MNVRVLAFSLLSLSSLAACSTTSGSYGLIKEDVYYLEPMAPHFVERRYVDRYACRGNVLLRCECYSMTSQCLCSC